jgi:hypothetical protein
MTENEFLFLGVCVLILAACSFWSIARCADDRER